MPLTLSKEERLCSRRLIDRLYADGHRMMAFPYSMQWLVEPSLEVPCQVLIVAPKRRFHNAVDRNRVKRLTRECYRHLKPQFFEALQQRGLRITLALVYIHNEILDYEKIHSKMEKALGQLIQTLNDETSVESAE